MKASRRPSFRPILSEILPKRMAPKRSPSMKIEIESSEEFIEEFSSQSQLNSVIAVFLKMFFGDIMKPEILIYSKINRCGESDQLVFAKKWMGEAKLCVKISYVRSFDTKLRFAALSHFLARFIQTTHWSLSPRGLRNLKEFHLLELHFSHFGKSFLLEFELVKVLHGFDGVICSISS